MDNPFNAVKDALGDLGKKIEHEVHVAVTKEAVIAGLSRLQTLDPDHISSYQAAIDCLPE